MFFKSVQWSAIVLAYVGMVLPMQHLNAADLNTSRQNMTQDVALADDGRLQGRVFTAEGAPQSVRLQLLDVRHNLVAETTADVEGKFAFEGTKPGVYHLVMEGGVTTCRCWTSVAAPPNANGYVLVASDDLILRGQRPIGEMLFAPPVLLTLLIAAAIAIPIAVHNAQDAS